MCRPVAKWGGCKGILASAARQNQGGQRRDSLACNAQAVAEKVIEGKPELPAGLHQPQQGVTRHATSAAHRAAGDLALGDERAQVVLRRIGMQWNLGTLQHLEQVVLASLQAHQALAMVPAQRMTADPELAGGRHRKARGGERETSGPP